MIVYIMGGLGNQMFQYAAGLGAATYSGGTLNIPQYQGVLTNPVTGTGTTNTLPKFTGASTIGDSNITDSGTLITLGSNTTISSGGLGIGITSFTGINLAINKTITGATTSYGVYQNATIQSDVTSQAYAFRSNISTLASAFTLSNLYHFAATNLSVGAGSTVTNNIGFWASSTLTGATNNYGFQGSLVSGTGNFNLFMSGTAANYLAGDTGIGVSANLVSSGPILTTTLTNGGSGYVDGTYTDLASSNPTSNGTGALFTVIVSGGIVTTATLTWAGVSYKVGDPLTIPNISLGGTGSGLIITVATVDSSQLTIANVNGGDISLLRVDASLAIGENLGTIKFLSNDSSSKAQGIYAEIGAYAASTAGGGYLSFFTRAGGSGTLLSESVRIDSRGGVGIGSTSFANSSLRVSKNITASTISYGVFSDGIVQSDVTNQAHYYSTNAQTQATAFGIGTIFHYRAIQGTFGAGSTVTSQSGFYVDNTLIGATNNYGFYGEMQMDKWMAKMGNDQTVPGFTTSVKTRPLVVSKMEEV